MSDCYIKDVYLKKMRVLFVYKSLIEKQKIIFLFHGLLENKFSVLPIAYRLAMQGFFVILLDTHGHGERQDSFDKVGYYDFNLIYQHAYETADDVNTIVYYLKDKYSDFDYKNIICSGISNGANIALISGYLVKNVTHVTTMIGSLNWGDPSIKSCFKSFKYFSKKTAICNESIVHDIEKYNPINNYINLERLPFVLFQNGVLDTTMPISSVVKSFKNLEDIYKSKKQIKKIILKKYDKSGHHVSEKMINDLCDWLKSTT